MILLASMVTGSLEGGIPVVNRLILDATSERGIRCDVNSLQDAEPPGESPWKGVRFRGAGGSKVRFLRMALAGPVEPAPGVVLGTHVRLAPVARVAALRRGARLLLFLHGAEAWRRFGAATFWGVRGCTALVANSRFTLEEFRLRHPGLAGIPGEVCLLPARSLSGGPGEGAAERGPPRAIVVGRLWGRGLRKGQAQLMDAWPEVVRRIPGAELWVVGEGEGRAGLESRARGLGTGTSVRFLGRLSDAELDRAYRSCSLFAMPSRGEGFGLVFAEAMARGLPCIASRFDAGSEVVVDGVTGIHVDPDAPAEVLGALLLLLGDRDLSRRMGEEGRRRADALFTVDRFRDNLVEILSRYGGVSP